jgi:hypothetical protein
VRLIRFLLAGALLADNAACAPRATEQGEVAPGPRGDAKTVTETELANATQLNLYDYLKAERPRWLQIGAGSRTGRAFATAVFQNETRIGTIETLRGFSVQGVRLVRFYEASAAQQKFTGRDIGPVIQVITK